MSDVRFSSASNAYTEALRAAERIIAKANGDDSSTDETSGTSGASFMSMVGNALKAAESKGYASEDMATRSLSNKASLSEVITAVSNAENALQTVVAVRDKVIGAYQEIIRMPI